MTQHKNHEALTKLLMYLFEAYEYDKKENQQQMFYIYYEAFIDIDVIWLANRIKTVIKIYDKKYKGDMPSIAYILKPLYEATDLELEKIWERFSKNCFKLDPPEDVIILKKQLGKSFINRYGLSNENEHKWFFVEFKRLYKEIKQIKNKLITAEFNPLIETNINNNIKKLANKMGI